MAMSADQEGPPQATASTSFQRTDSDMSASQSIQVERDQGDSPMKNPPFMQFLGLPNLSEDHSNAGDKSSDVSALHAQTRQTKGIGYSSRSFSQILRGKSLTWRDVTIMIKGKRAYSEKVVSTSTGYALPNRIAGLMGPPHSGKSTLLRALSGHLPRSAKVYGEILKNGQLPKLNDNLSVFINKAGQLIEMLTVEETLKFSAFLQLPKTFTVAQKVDAVDEVLKIMELQDISGSLVGGYLRRKGLTMSERRRLCVGLQVLRKPSFVFIDEPLHSLDSVSALVTIMALKRLSQTGCTVLLSLQSCSADVFNLIDRICLMAKGKTIFFGSPVACVEHFANAGFPCPPLQNPGDFFVCALNPGYEALTKCSTHWQESETLATPISTAVTIQTLETFFKGCNEARVLESLVLQLSQMEGTPKPSEGNTTPFRQILALTHRSFIHMLRDWRYFWLRCLIGGILMACIGTMYLGFKNSFSTQEQTSAIFYMVFVLCLIGICGFQTSLKEMQVHIQEVLYGHFGRFVTFNFLLGNLISSIPFLFSMAIICLAIGFMPLVLFSDFSSFAYFALIIFLCVLISESLMMLIASILPQVFEGTIVVIVTQVFFMLLSGYIRHADGLSQTFWKYPAYLCFYAYAFEGYLQNQLISSDMPTVQEYNAELVNYSLSGAIEGRWNSVFVLTMMAVAFRALVFISIELQKLRGDPSKHRLLRTKGFV